MAITIDFINRNTDEEGIRVYRSLTPFTQETLPEVYDTIGPGQYRYVDELVARGQEFHYMLETFRGDDSGFSELLLAKALPIETGPGPQLLIGGDSRAGFYGEVPVGELINGTALATLIGLTDGVAYNDNEPWLKFSLDGETLFVAKAPYRHTISWDMINAVNAVSGDRIIQIAGEDFSIGLLEGLGKDHSVISAGYDPQISHGSEWNRLMYNVALPLGTASDIRDSQVGDQWANYNQAGVAGGLWLSGGNGRFSWCKETNPTNATQGVFRGNISVSLLNYNASSSASSGYGWRPRLKLITQ